MSFRLQFCWYGVRCNTMDQRVTALNLLSLEIKGALSASIGNLTFLEELILDNNFFHGTIPYSLGNLSNLRILSASDNVLEGRIPEELGKLSNLEFLKLSSNKLSGEVPLQLFKISSIQYLNLASNHLNGSFPSDFGLNHSKLHTFVVAENQFFGPLPVSITNASGLVILEIGTNALSGPVPMNMGDLIHLQRLDISKNPLGTSDSALPNSVANLSTELTSLRLDRNYISGEIPDNLENLVNLGNLAMSQNMLTGRIPKSIGKLTKLEGLYLSGNKFIGNIPGSIGNITQLSILEMRGNKLEGRIPVSLGNCTRLQGLDLSRNRLTGTIPKDLFGLSSLTYSLNLAHNLLSGTLPIEWVNLTHLGSLDVSNNRLSGILPVTIADCVFLEFLSLRGNILDVTGNGKLCGGVKSLQLPKCQRLLPSAEGKTSLFVVLILVFVIFPIVLLLAYVQQKCQKKLTSDSPLGDQFPKISYTELFQTTDGFSEGNLIARGRYSSVYKGSLNYSDKTVAVKVINLQNQGSRRSFTAECESLRNVRHRNLAKIITACSGTDYEGNEFKALVYEFMAGGSLESWLHPSSSNSMQPKNLNLIQRLNIAIDVASALVYLHHFCAIPVIHRDIKPSNILLDNELCAHLGDFSSARSLLLAIDRSRNEGIRARTIELVGTVGYVALGNYHTRFTSIFTNENLEYFFLRAELYPWHYCIFVTLTDFFVSPLLFTNTECGMGAPASTLVDVYSYGVLLLEMFTGKRPTNSMFKDDFSLRNYVKMGLPDQVMRIADPKLSSECETEFEKCLASIFHVGVTCSAHLPERRMRIADVLMELQAARYLYLKCG
ncbi:unnamed protein product [Coffea canephora]|uniref:DH200=94 genomic scaffold, scaffold_1847 n=1 Tax=Coffea canephora TaxID=49390 RepID=A0A068VJQ3_COFCA|nr:unnamed protein product [Coffea canephora]